MLLFLQHFLDIVVFVFVLCVLLHLCDAVLSPNRKKCLPGPRHALLDSFWLHMHTFGGPLKRCKLISSQPPFCLVVILRPTLTHGMFRIIVHACIGWMRTSFISLYKVKYNQIKYDAMQYVPLSFGKWGPLAATMIYRYIFHIYIYIYTYR